MEEQKVMTVVELVLREQERITSLPNIVRSIRQFIQASLLARLKGIMLITSPSVSRIEQILTMDSEDRRLEALERSHHEQKSTVNSETLLTAETKVVCAVFWLGAQCASLQIVEWALNTSAVLPINEALEMAVNEGHLAIVRALYPRVGDFGCARCKNEDELVESAASRGHLEILEWLVNYRSKTSKPCFLLVAMRCAAGGGHLDVVKWIHAKEPGKWTHVALEQAALHNQQLVMDWIHQEHLPVAASFAMQSAMWKGNWSALAWLHDKYPDDRGGYQTAKRRRLGSQLEVVNC